MSSQLHPEIQNRTFSFRIDDLDAFFYYINILIPSAAERCLYGDIEPSQLVKFHVDNDHKKYAVPEDMKKSDIDDIVIHFIVNKIHLKNIAALKYLRDTA